MRCYEIFGKRTFDLFFSLLALVLFFPLFLLLGILIKLDSKGPVFFMQKRMGKNGILFSLIKFRTMYVDVEREKLFYEPGSIDRVTLLGRILRRTKLDELPQIINVLKGDMSFVGPRPEVPKYKHYYEGEYKSVLDVKPGISDEASIKYICEEETLVGCQKPEKYYEETLLPDKLKINLGYVKNKLSLKGDMEIVAKTLRNLLWEKR